MNESFPCRTKEISRIIYSVSIYSLETNSLVMRWEDDSEYNANLNIDNLHKTCPNKYTVEIQPQKWTKMVCIECGEESTV